MFKILEADCFAFVPEKVVSLSSFLAVFFDAVEAALLNKRVKKGDIVVITAGIPLGQTGKTNMIRVVEV